MEKAKKGSRMARAILENTQTVRRVARVLTSGQTNRRTPVVGKEIASTAMVLILGTMEGNTQVLGRRT